METASPSVTRHLPAKHCVKPYFYWTQPQRALRIIDRFRPKLTVTRKKAVND